MKRFEGYIPRPMDWRVRVREADSPRTYLLDTRLAYVNHSPDGFAWGYNGSAPAQLAFAILFEVTLDEDVARAYYQAFKSEFISKYDKDQPFELKEEVVLGWLETKNVYVTNQGGES